MLACLLIKCCKKMTAYSGCAGLARSPFVLTEHISSWRASEASETLSGVTQSRFRYIYLFIYLFIWYVGPLFPPGLLIVKREELRVSHF